MPSEMMNPRGFSPSFFHEEVRFSDERQGVRKMDHMAGYPGLKSDGTLRAEGVASSPLENRIPVDSQREKGFGLPEYYLNRGRNVNLSFIGAERAASHSLPNAVDHDLGAIASLNMESASYFVDGDKINLIGAQYENGLFSSSLSDLFSRNLKLSSHNAGYGHSVGEEEAFESLEELEAQTIGNLLPDDDDLLSGVTDGFDMEDVDLFSSVGGMELGEEISNNQLGLSGGSNPSRTLFVRNINCNVEDSELQTLFEQYGDIHTLYTACKHRGFVMISYYDLRAACNAMKALQNKPLRRRKLDIHFSIPKENPSEKDINQGTLVIFNLDSSVSNDKLREIFGVYGEIKEIHESPNGCHQKYIEFYDVRAAESALRALNMSEIAGKQIILEACLRGGPKRLTQPFPLELEQEEPGLHFHHQSSPNNLASGFSGSLSFGGSVKWTDNRSTNGGPIDPLLDNVFHPSSVPNSLPSLVRVEKGNQSSIMESGHLWNPLKFDFQGAQNLHPHSLPEYHDGLANGHPFGSPTGISANISSRAPEMIDSQQFRRVNSSGQSIELNEVFGSSGNGSGRHYMWNNSHHPLQNLWPNSPQFNGMGRSPSHMMNALLPINNHHVGSAPSVNPSLWDRRPEFHPGSLGNMRISGNLEFVHHNIFPPSAMDMPIPSKTIGLHPHQQRCMMFPTMMSSLDSPSERTRNRRSEGISSQGGDSKRQFELDVDRILRGEDKRTTLMIKNIPNKYTSKMLLAAIDERHRGTYDFIYLPIDFKNKCNVGYAFINMTDPSLIVPFYQTFNGKKWEKFNSEKVASLAYGRIQGKSALIAHFQNSSLMNEDKRCRPILFHTDGPNAGDQVPFPMGSNIRARPGKTRAEENNQPSAEDYLNGDLSSSGSD